ncbi:MAG: 2Fe-2S iron-sulfur cluster binding domain-containing protein, partial [Clostridia bacterium]|nr:2Fe-2S iron-sulfur cluster binding domain-containing protein [Clostridia bacterium]
MTPNTVVVPSEAAGMRLSDYLNQNGHTFAAPCGGKGICGKCTVKLIGGRLASVSDPTQTLLPDENGNILSCRALCTEDGAVIALPTVTGSGLVIEEDQNRISDKNGVFGVALDIGTTTLAAALVEKNEKKVVATASVLNPQSGFGADVMSRIAACEAGQLEAMQKALLAEVSLLCETLLKKVGLSCDTKISELAVAGNPTMLHIFCGVSPRGMGSYPFTPVFLETKRLAGEDLGLLCETVTVLPSASAFIGSDVLGGALTEKMLDKDEPTLLL